MMRILTIDIAEQLGERLLPVPRFLDASLQLLQFLELELDAVLGSNDLLELLLGLLVQCRVLLQVAFTAFQLAQMLSQLLSEILLLLQRLDQAHHVLIAILHNMQIPPSFYCQVPPFIAGFDEPIKLLRPCDSRLPDLLAFAENAASALQHIQCLPHELHLLYQRSDLMLLLELHWQPMALIQQPYQLAQV